MTALDLYISYLHNYLISHVGTGNWRPVYKQMMDDSVVKHRYNNVEWIFAGQVDMFCKCITAAHNYIIVLSAV